VARRWPNYKQKGSFSGASGFKQTTGTQGNVKPILQKFPAYNLHHPTRKHFERRRVRVDGMHRLYAMDLKDIQSESRYNNKKRFLLVMMDVFSKRAWIEALPNKTGKAVVKGLEKIFARAGGVAPKIWCDYGREFYNVNVESWLRAKGVKLMSVTSPLKCCIIERFIRTLFEKIQRYLTHNNTRKFVDKLPYFEDLYNNSYHRSIRMSPNQVTKDNESQVYENLYSHNKPVDYKPSKLNVGDKVLRAKIKTVFEKGYKQNYEKEVYTILKVIHTIPRIYRLADSKGKEVSGTFYQQQLLQLPGRP